MFDCSTRAFAGDVPAPVDVPCTAVRRCQETLGLSWTRKEPTMTDHETPTQVRIQYCTS
jgi:hypothetical protein